MGYFDGIQAPAPGTGGSTGGGYFDNFKPIDPAVSDKIGQYDQQQTQYDQATQDAGGFTGILKGTLKNIGTETAGAAKEIGGDIWNTWKQTPGKWVQDVQDAKAINDKAMVNDKNNAGASFRDAGRMLWSAAVRPAADFAAAVFAPISAALGYALKKSGYESLQDKAGKTIVDSSGITDNKAFQQFAIQHPNFGEDFNRVITLLMSGEGDGKSGVDPAKIVDHIGQMADRTIKQAIPEGEGTKVPVQSETPLPSKVGVNTPNSIHADYAKSQGYEPYTANNQLPEIQMGNKGGTPSDLPTIQMDGSTRAPNRVPGDFTFEPITESTPVPAQEPGYFDNMDTSEVRTKPPLPQFESDRPVVNGEQVTKSASDINAKLVQQGFGDMSHQDLAKFTPIEIKDQVNRVSSLMDSDIEKAKAIALGQEPVPEGIHPKVLYNAVEKYADQSGDPQLSLDLAKSPLAKITSEAGQNLAVERFTGNNNESPTKIIQDVQSARESKLKPSSDGTTKVSKVANDIDSAIKKNTPNKADWKDFISSLACK